MPPRRPVMGSGESGLARALGEIDGKLDLVIGTQKDHGDRLRKLELVAEADRAVASRVAQMRADGTITKRWVIQTLIAFLVGIAVIVGTAIAIAKEAGL